MDTRELRESGSAGWGELNVEKPLVRSSIRVPELNYIDEGSAKVEATHFGRGVFGTGHRDLGGKPEKRDCSDDARDSASCCLTDGRSAAANSASEAETPKVDARRLSNHN
jgi:hypothetical protein